MNNNRSLDLLLGEYQIDTKPLYVSSSFTTSKVIGTNLASCTMRIMCVILRGIALWDWKHLYRKVCSIKTHLLHKQRREQSRWFHLVFARHVVICKMSLLLNWAYRLMEAVKTEVNSRQGLVIWMLDKVITSPSEGSIFLFNKWTLTVAGLLLLLSFVLN